MEKSFLPYDDTVTPTEKIKMSAAKGVQRDFSYQIIISELNMNTCNVSFILLAKKKKKKIRLVFQKIETWP